MNIEELIQIPPSRHTKERRRLSRQRVNLGALLGGSITRRTHVCVCDISAIGCRISARCRFNPGDFLTVSLPSFGPFGGSVVWVREHCIGFEFARPLHPAVVTKIVGMSRPNARVPARPTRLAS